jgi:hypothetical protein
MTKIIPAALALVMLAAPACASGCLQVGRTWSWKPLDKKTLVVEDELHQKFRLTLEGYCPRLPFKLNLAIQSTSGVSRLDCVRRGDNVISEDVGTHYTCPVMSVVPLGQDIVSPNRSGP